MTNGIFNQRLHDETRYKRVLHLGGDLSFDAQVFCETNLLDREVVVEKSQFLRQWNFLPVPRIERQAKQIAQMLDHSARQPRIALDVRRDGVERVEEKMRVKLHAQRIQARLRKAAFHSF